MVNIMHPVKAEYFVPLNHCTRERAEISVLWRQARYTWHRDGCAVKLRSNIHGAGKDRNDRRNCTSSWNYDGASTASCPRRSYALAS
jgi:hypothetical protein